MRSNSPASAGATISARWRPFVIGLSSLTEGVVFFPVPRRIKRTLTVLRSIPSDANPDGSPKRTRPSEWLEKARKSGGRSSRRAFSLRRLVSSPGTSLRRLFTSAEAQVSGYHFLSDALSARYIFAPKARRHTLLGRLLSRHRRSPARRVRRIASLRGSAR